MFDLNIIQWYIVFIWTAVWAISWAVFFACKDYPCRHPYLTIAAGPFCVWLLYGLLSLSIAIWRM